MNNTTINKEDEMYFDRFDICEAWYLYASHYHGGQWSKLYSILSYRLPIVLGFKPGAQLDGYMGLTDNGKEIYDNLVSRQLYQ